MHLLVLRTHHPWVVSDYFAGVIRPIALFPLNSKYITREALHRNVFGFLGDVAPAAGPEDKPGSSLAFLGNGNSFIEFPRHPQFDSKKSLTLLAWVFPEKPGPVINYTTNLWGTQLLLLKSNQLVGRITHPDGTLISQDLASKRVQPGEWNFVGLSYDHVSGIAHLWINGEVADRKRVGQMDLGTNFPASLGPSGGGKRNFKGRVACMQVYDVSLNKHQVATAKNACRKFQWSAPDPGNCSVGSLPVWKHMIKRFWSGFYIIWTYRMSIHASRDDSISSSLGIFKPFHSQEWSISNFSRSLTRNTVLTALLRVR